MERGGQSFFYHADGLGSTTEITNQSGIVVQRYTYSTFGKIESQLDPNFVQPYTFTAREFDFETGLHFYRARYYNPMVGRFISEDPRRFAGAVNFYRYVGNNPGNYIDPFGLITTVVITYDYGIGTHAAVRVDNSSDSFLYDPGGSYLTGSRGSGDFFTGNEADLDRYIRYHQSIGSTVETIIFNTTPEEERQIARNIENAPNPGFLGCSLGVSNVIQGVGPFKDIGRYRYPNDLARTLRDLQERLLRNQRR